MTHVKGTHCRAVTNETLGKLTANILMGMVLHNCAKKPTKWNNHFSYLASYGSALLSVIYVLLLHFLLSMHYSHLAESK
jgi:hypothetical protein